MVVRSMLVLTLLLTMSACERRATDAPPPAKSGQLPMAPPGATGARAAGLVVDEPEQRVPMPGLGPDPDLDDEEPPPLPLAPDAGGGGVEL